jgi:hypothetical protein
MAAQHLILRVQTAWWFPLWTKACILLARCGYVVSDDYVSRVLNRAFKISAVDA